MPLSASFELKASGLLTETLDLSAPVDSVTAGTGNFPAAAFDLTNGNGDLQAQSWWHDLRTLAAGASENLPIIETGPFAQITFVTIRAILAVIKDPLPTKKLQIGPMGVANTPQLWFGGVGVQAYTEFDRFLFQADVYGGWPLDNVTAFQIPVKNSGSVSLDYAIWILGTTS